MREPTHTCAGVARSACTDAMSAEQAAMITRSSNDPSVIARKLVKGALKNRGLRDDTSCMVLQLGHGLHGAERAADGTHAVASLRPQWPTRALRRSPPRACHSSVRHSRSHSVRAQTPLSLSLSPSPSLFVCARRGRSSVCGHVGSLCALRLQAAGQPKTTPCRRGRPRAAWAACRGSPACSDRSPAHACPST
jgi:hypothetical protein